MSDQLMSSLGARLQLIDESFRDGVAEKYLDGYGLHAAGNRRKIRVQKIRLRVASVSKAIYRGYRGAMWELSEGTNPTTNSACLKEDDLSIPELLMSFLQSFLNRFLKHFR